MSEGPAAEVRPVCATDGCENPATPYDWRGECLTCNPYGDSLVMNCDPEYQAWLFRSESEPDYGESWGDS